MGNPWRGGGRGGCCSILRVRESWARGRGRGDGLGRGRGGGFVVFSGVVWRGRAAGGGVRAGAGGGAAGLYGWSNADLLEFFLAESEGKRTTI